MVFVSHSLCGLQACPLGWTAASNGAQDCLSSNIVCIHETEVRSRLSSLKIQEPNDLCERELSPQ